MTRATCFPQRGCLSADFPEGILEYHYAYVERVVPPDRLYWMELSEGWAPLSRMLNKPSPLEPYPRANDSEAVEATARYVLRRTAMVWVCIFLVAAGTLCVVGRCI